MFHNFESANYVSTIKVVFASPKVSQNLSLHTILTYPSVEIKIREEEGDWNKRLDECIIVRRNL
jgi:hypothetical protein